MLANYSVLVSRANKLKHRVCWASSSHIRYSWKQWILGKTGTAFDGDTLRFLGYGIDIPFVQSAVCALVVSRRQTEIHEHVWLSPLADSLPQCSSNKNRSSSIPYGAAHRVLSTRHFSLLRLGVDEYYSSQIVAWLSVHLLATVRSLIHMTPTWLATSVRGWLCIPFLNSIY